MTENEHTDNSEIIFSIPCLVIIYFFWSAPFTKFGQAVNFSNVRDGAELDFPFLSLFGFSESFFPLTSTFLLCIFLWGIREIFPNPLKRKIVWDTSLTYQQEKPLNNAKPAVCSALFAVVGTAALIFAAFHIRSDRTHRQPVITWEGPAAEYFEWLLVLGWTLSYLGFVAGMFAEQCFISRWNWLRYIGMMGFGNFTVSFFVYCGLYED